MPSAPNPWDYSERYGSEHAHQVALFMWANMAVRFGYFVSNYKEAYCEPGWAMANQREDKLVALKWLHAIHNQGHGDAIRGAKAKAEGVKAGVSDLFLPRPVRYDGGCNLALPGVYHPGFYLELKVGKNSPSNDQLEFQADMKALGYKVDVAWGWLEAREKLLDYLQLPRYEAAISQL